MRTRSPSFPSLSYWLWFLGFGIEFGQNRNICGHRFGSLQVLDGAGVGPLVHVPHLVHQEDRLRPLASRPSIHYTDALLCVQRPPDLLKKIYIYIEKENYLENESTQPCAAWKITHLQGHIISLQLKDHLEPLRLAFRLSDNKLAGKIWACKMLVLGLHRLSWVFPGELHRHILLPHRRAADTQVLSHSQWACRGLDYRSWRSHGVWRDTAKVNDWPNANRHPAIIDLHGSAWWCFSHLCTHSGCRWACTW